MNTAPIISRQILALTAGWARNRREATTPPTPTVPAQNSTSSAVVLRIPIIEEFTSAFAPLIRPNRSVFWCYNTVDAPRDQYWLMEHAQKFAGSIGGHTVEMLVKSGGFKKPEKNHPHQAEFWTRASKAFAELTNGNVICYQGEVPKVEMFRKGVVWVQHELPILTTRGRIESIKLVRHKDRSEEFIWPKKSN